MKDAPDLIGIRSVRTTYRPHFQATDRFRSRRCICCRERVSRGPARLREGRQPPIIVLNFQSGCGSGLTCAEVGSLISVDFGTLPGWSVAHIYRKAFPTLIGSSSESAIASMRGCNRVEAGLGTNIVEGHSFLRDSVGGKPGIADNERRAEGCNLQLMAAINGPAKQNIGLAHALGGMLALRPCQSAAVSSGLMRQICRRIRRFG